MRSTANSSKTAAQRKAGRKRGLSLISDRLVSHGDPISHGAQRRMSFLLSGRLEQSASQIARAMDHAFDGQSRAVVSVEDEVFVKWRLGPVAANPFQFGVIEPPDSAKGWMAGQLFQRSLQRR